MVWVWILAGHVKHLSSKTIWWMASACSSEVTILFFPCSCLFYFLFNLNNVSVLCDSEVTFLGKGMYIAFLPFSFLFCLCSALHNQKNVIKFSCLPYLNVLLLFFFVCVSFLRAFLSFCALAWQLFPLDDD